MRNIVFLRVLLFAGLASMLASILPTAAQAQSTETWVSGTGNDSNSATGCQITAPCRHLGTAIPQTTPGGTVFCASPIETPGTLTISQDITIDCSQGSAAIPSSCIGSEGVDINTAGIKVTLRGLTIYSFDASACSTGSIGVHITAAALVRIENCKIFGFNGPGVEVVPSSGNVVLKIQDSPITQNGGGVLVAPTGGASVSISIERSQLESNNGGGIKTDSANGIINLDIIESQISNNDGVGVNARAGGSLNMVSIKNSVIAKNSAQGVQANGANVGVTVQTTLFDQNASGATSVVAGGHISTYGNNSIVGSSGSGFTGTASLQ
jgi:hypothetical protein